MSEGSPRPARWAPWVVCAVAATVYLNTLWGEFVYDDYPFIVENPAVHSLERPWKFLVERDAMSAEGFYTIYRPVAGWLSSLTWAVAGPTPAAFHFVNLLAHALAACCVWRLARALGLGPAGGALWAALVFAVHPVQTEAVAWIAGLSNPLVVIGVTNACVAWLRWREAGAPPRHGLAVGAWYAFALLAKEHAVALPLLVLGLEWALRREGLRPAAQRAAAVAALVLVTGAYVGWRAHVLGQTGQTGYLGGSLGPTLLTMVIGFRTYLRLLWWPTNLHPEYILPIVSRLGAPGLLPSMALLAALVGAALLLRRRAPWLALGIAWWFLALAPVSNVVPMKTLINERLLYLPLIGFALVLGAAWDGVPHRVVRGLLVAQLALFGVLTVARNRAWQTNERLWTAAVASEPLGYTSHFNLGQVYRQQGDTEGALRQFARAIELRGRFPHAHGAVGQVHLERGEHQEAVHAFRRGLREAPDSVKLRQNLVAALVQWGDAERAAGRPVIAEGAYREALALEADTPAARAGLAAVRGGQDT